VVPAWLKAERVVSCSASTACLSTTWEPQSDGAGCHYAAGTHASQPSALSSLAVRADVMAAVMQCNPGRAVSTREPDACPTSYAPVTRNVWRLLPRIKPHEKSDCAPVASPQAALRTISIWRPRTAGAKPPSMPRCSALCLRLRVGASPLPCLAAIPCLLPAVSKPQAYPSRASCATVPAGPRHGVSAQAAAIPPHSRQAMAAACAHGWQGSAVTPRCSPGSPWVTCAATQTLSARLTWGR